MRILVTGGCGYVGSVLVPKLLNAGHRVVIVDAGWFGVNFVTHENLEVVQQDIRGIDRLYGNEDAIIHLAGVANDPCGELDPKLSWEANALATTQLAALAARNDVKQFIYASSGSVYGIKGDKTVTEDETLVPVSEYNKTKMVAERVLLSYADQMAIQIVRPGTVCGVSPRQRLDVSVNGMTMQALTKGEIKVGGSHLMRSNIHIEDMADVYLFMLEHPELTGIYNAAFQNVSLGDIAEAVSKRTKCNVVEVPVTDPRSYRISSAKLIGAGYIPKHTIKMAIAELCEAYRNGFRESDNCHNLRTMNDIGVGSKSAKNITVEIQMEKRWREKLSNAA